MTRKGNTVQINISVDRDLDEKIREAAVRERRSLSNWCAVALEKAVREADDA